MTSSRFTKLLCAVVFPVQWLVARLVAGHISVCARVDRWRNSRPTKDVQHRADPVYQRYLTQEIAYWQNPPHGDEQTVHGNDEHPLRHVRLRRYWNQLLTGSPDKDKVQMLRELGPFEHALVLAHCPKLETIIGAGVARRWTCNSITGRFAGAQPGTANVTIVSEDLNFVQLEAGAYDLIIAEGVLHHILNADDLLMKVSRAMSRRGVFYVMEYIGEERFLWRAEKRRFLNRLLASLPLKFLRYKFASVDVIPLGHLSPFEAVTSTELPSLLRKHFSPVEERKGYGVLFPVLEFLKPEYLMEDNPALDALLRADQECERHHVLPSTLVGIYRKRAASHKRAA